MASHANFVGCILKLCCLLNPSIHAFRYSSVEFEEDGSPKPSRNTDRLSCIRQDNLDLIVPPSSEYILRQVVGISPTSTAQDIVLVATGIQVDFSAFLEISRYDATHIRFELKGNKPYRGHNDVVELDFVLTGLEVITSSTAIDWATSVTVNRESLSGHQTGTARFKLAGEAEAVWSEEKHKWEMKVTAEKVEPFGVQITNQYILTEAITRAGGIDTILENFLWPYVQRAIPPSLGTAFNYIPLEDLWFYLKGTVEGRMEQVNSPLALNVKLESRGVVSPSKFVSTFTEHFNVPELARHRVDYLLADDRMRALWVKSKDTFLETLVKYGFEVGEDLIQAAPETETLEQLHPFLIADAALAADVLVHAMQPLVRAESGGQTGFFDGFHFHTLLDMCWCKEKGGRIRGQEVTPNASKVVLPPALFSVLLEKLNIKRYFAIPEQGLTDIDVQKLRTTGSTLKLAYGDLDQVLLIVGNGSDAAVWQLDGKMSNMELRFPEPIVPGLTLAAEHVHVRMDSHGRGYWDNNKGIEFELENGESTDEPVITPLLRTGPAKQIDGQLPREFARPSKKYPVLARDDLLPKFHVKADVKIHSDNENRMTIDALVEVKTEVAVAEVVPPVLAPKVNQDFGYVFHTGFFHWKRLFDKGIHTDSIEVVAVVSCGFLRLLTRYEGAGRNLERVDFQPTPTGGQLELDISQYKEPIEETPGASCVNLMQSGMIQRGFSWLGLKSASTGRDHLCGSAEAVSKLIEALNLQIVRFLDPRAEQWNYGTHPTDLKMFDLPEDTFSSPPLLDIVSRTAQEGRMTHPMSPTTVDKNPAPSSEAEQASETAAALNGGMLQTESGLTKSTWVGKSPQREPREKWRRRSKQRQQCKANQELTSIYFPPPEPPDQKAQPILLMAFSGLPAVGDLHVKLDDLYVSQLAFKFIVKRLDDNTFSFEIGGSGKEHGHANVYVDGLEIQTPDGLVEGVVKGIIGRLNAPVDLWFHIKGDFHNDGNEWHVIEQSAVHKADINFGAGGRLKEMLNRMINGAGGIDKLFFDKIWPHVIRLIPGGLGAAFRSVPASLASVGYEMDVSGECPEGMQERKCPSRTLDIRASGKIVTYSYKAAFFKGVYENSIAELPNLLAKAFEFDEKENEILRKSFFSSTFKLKADKNKGMLTNVSVTSYLPMNLLVALAGPNILTYSPDEKSLLVNAGVQVKDGSYHFPRARIANVSVPYALRSGALSALHLDLSLEGFTAKQITDEKPEGGPSSVGFNAPTLRVEIEKTEGMRGLKLGPTNAEVTLTPEYLWQNILRPDAFVPPVNFRMNASERADGVMPAKFRTPPPRYPGLLNFSELLIDAEAEIGIQFFHAMNPIAGNIVNDKDVFHLETKFELSLSIALTKVGLQGLVDKNNPDSGYIFYQTPGYFGQVRGNELLPSTEALAMLNCGSLQIYRARPGARPFRSKLKMLSLDLFSDRLSWQPREVDGTDFLCLTLRESGHLLGMPMRRPDQFCGPAKETLALREGIMLQKKRFASAEMVSSEYPGSDIGVLGEDALPDGTWFMDQNPKNYSTFFPKAIYPREDEVVTPTKMWNDAVEFFHNRQQGQA